MLEWGFFGLGDGMAGAFLANHFSTLGPYFGDNIMQDWPHSPFSKAPTQLELAFHQKMIEITKILSNGTLKDVSILDLPAFGSSIPWLDKHHRRAKNWPTEINFAILKHSNGSLYAMFKDYKELIEDWKNYLTGIYKDDPQAKFTPAMESNKFFDFTKHIRADMKTFLISIHGAHLGLTNTSLPIWSNVAEKLFNRRIENKNDVLDKGLYDQLIMNCALRKNLLNRRKFDNEEMGCDIFLPTLTTKGFCQTFNGQTPSDTWMESEITTEFQKLFPTAHPNEYFLGGGISEGDKNIFKDTALLIHMMIKTLI